MCIHTHTYNGIPLRHKENKVISFSATQMDLDIIILNDVLQKFHLLILVCETLKKKQDKWTCLQNRKRLTVTENNLIVNKGEGYGGGINQELGMNIYTLLMHKTDKGQQGPYYTALNTQYSVITYLREKSKKNEYISIRTKSHPKLRQSFKSTIFQ